MTREEAITYLEDAKSDLPYMFEQALDMAIEVLQAPEIVRCKDCKHRYGDECPMRHVEWVECEEDGFIEMDDIVHDNTQDDGYCSFGEREDGEVNGYIYQRHGNAE